MCIQANALANNQCFLDVFGTHCIGVTTIPGMWGWRAKIN